MHRISFRLKFFIVLQLTVMVIGVVGFMITERLSLPDAMYFTVVTVATVGYGDIHPYTMQGKMLAVFLIVTGVGTFLGVIANATDLLLDKREKELRMEKLNIIIGLFFSEAGTNLLSYFIDYDLNSENISKSAFIGTDWNNKDFQKAKIIIKNHNYEIDKSRIDYEKLRIFLEDKSTLFLRLMENQNLLEHESFTSLLRAILHLKEELLCREDLANLPDTDFTHLAGDIKRIYSMIVPQWLDYMSYLKNHYPYLYSLAVRMNPFNTNRSPVVLA